MSLAEIVSRANPALERLSFSDPVACVYNPLSYAWALHEQYLKAFGGGTKQAVLLGMNPGPFGMVQTGVPFGEVEAVKTFQSPLHEIFTQTSEFSDLKKPLILFLPPPAPHGRKLQLTET